MSVNFHPNPSRLCLSVGFCHSFEANDFPLQIVREVELHRNLRHKHVVCFHSYFEDDENVYIVLEVCSRKVLLYSLLYIPVLAN